MKLEDIIDLKQNPINDANYKLQCKDALDKNGALVIDNFITRVALERIKQEGQSKKDLAYFTQNNHNVYISDSDPKYADDHPRNRLVESSKGCITDKQIDKDSPLRTLYDNQDFRLFLKDILGEDELYEYADEYSSINLHYASKGQELGWHFDNSSFATTLLIQKPEAGGVFQYVRDLRDADKGEMNFDAVDKVLTGTTTPDFLSFEPGALVLFRGRNAIHRVTPTEGEITRMLVVFAYNSKPDISLSSSARKTFYGK